MNIELSLLAVMLKKGDFGPIINGHITEDHFGTDEGKILFNFITTYRKESDGRAQYPSLKIVRGRFKHLELPDPEEGDTVANLSHETIQAKFRSDLRQLAAEAEEIANSASDPIADVLPLISKLRKTTESHIRTQHVSLETGLHDVVERYDQGELLVAGIDWPWPSMTKASKGIRPGEFIVIAGRPKSRKTFTALRIATHAVKHSHKRVLVFTPEMPPQQIFLRCVAHFCDLPYAEFKDGTMDEAQAMRLYEAAKIFGRIKDMTDENYLFHLKSKIPGLGDARPSLDIVKSTGRDTTWMASQIEIYKPDIVIADSFYRQRAQGAKKNDVDYKAITALSRELKDLSMEANVALIGTHQLNREAQRSVGDISNISWADGISHDADAIYRVVTGKINGIEASALLNLAAREVNHDGVLIRNVPCYDYSEIGTITNRQQVADLMKQEEASAAREETEQLRERAGDAAAAGARAGKKPKRDPLVNMGRIRRPAMNISKNPFHKDMQKTEAAAHQAMDRD
jgi:hypothetical protein